MSRWEIAWSINLCELWWNDVIIMWPSQFNYCDTKIDIKPIIGMTEIWFLWHNLLNGAINRNKITVEASVQCTYHNVSNAIHANK